jgi:hypothetical protein
VTSQRLYGILKLVDSLDKDLGLQTTLEAIKENLNNLVSSPAQPTYQSQLATALDTFTKAVLKMAEAISPSNAAIIHEIGGSAYFDPLMADNVTHSVQTNAMTPSVARDFVQDLATKRATFLATVKSARQALEKLLITDAALAPGTADVTFLIPRDIFDNELGSFAKELKFITRLLQHYTEAQTATTEPITLEQLSSSIPAIALVANLAALSILGTVINKFLGAWLKFEEIRELRMKLAKLGLKGTALKELDETIAINVTEVIEESTALVIANYPGNSADRKNELSNAIKADTRRLFAQIEHGLTVEFRAEPKPGDGGDQKRLEEIANVAKVLKFPKIVAANDPLLLGKGEIIEDASEIEDDDGSVRVLKQSKTTTKTTTSTTTKKPTQGDGQEK